MKDKKRLSLIISAMLLGVFLLTGCMDKSNKAILETVNQLEKNDPEVVWQLCSKDSQSTFGEAGIKARMQRIDNLLGVKSVNYKNLKLLKEESNNHKRVYNGKVDIDTKYGMITRDLKLTFVADPDKEGQWLIDWKPEVILPGLTKDNGLKVESKPARRGTIFDRHGQVLAKNNDGGQRIYPNGVVTGSMLGFVRAATSEEVAAGTFENITVGTLVGRAGLEKVYQNQLSGQNGLKVTFTDKPDDVVINSQPKNGQDIYTTIDLNVQRAAYNQVAGEFGAVVGMNPQNGQVLCLVSTPSYDPINWMDGAMSAVDYHQAVESGQVPNDGIYTQIFTPGSTEKLFTTLVGLDAGTLTWDTRYNIYGSDWQPDTSWGGYHVHRVTPINGPIGLRQALISSDNIFFARVGLDLGAEKLVSGLEKLGYQKDVPGDLKIQKSQITGTGKIDPYHQTGIADTSYGQYQIQISPYQLCMTYGLLGNGGKIMKPQLLLTEAPKVWIDHCISEANLPPLKEALRQATAITHPTAERSYAAFTGKTGTAEVGPGGKINLGWYAGYDQNNPTCTMVVMINHVENRGGSDFNTLIFGRIMDQLYQSGPYHPGIGILKEREAEKKKQEDMNENIKNESVQSRKNN